MLPQDVGGQPDGGLRTAARVDQHSAAENRGVVRSLVKHADLARCREPAVIEAVRAAWHWRRVSWSEHA